MELAALVSGGKDSMLALYRAYLEGHSVRYLLTMEPLTPESYMFHHPNTWVAELISKSTGIPLVKAATQGVKEEELLDLRTLFESISDEIDGIVSGALASSYQKTRIDGLCRELSLKSIAPLWHIDPLELWQELFDLNFEIMITSVAAEGLDESWLGRIMDGEAFEELEGLSRTHRFHLGFEGGEAETLVLDMPLYKERIAVKSGERFWEGSSGVYRIKEAVLEWK